MTVPESISRFRVPLGSLVVDGALVMTLVFSTGQMMERFDQMDARIQELQSIRAETRLNSLELRAVHTERWQGELKIDIMKRLDRIEQLLDRERGEK